MRLGVLATGAVGSSIATKLVAYLVLWLRLACALDTRHLNIKLPR